MSIGEDWIVLNTDYVKFQEMLRIIKMSNEVWSANKDSLYAPLDVKDDVDYFSGIVSSRGAVNQNKNYYGFDNGGYEDCLDKPIIIDLI